MMGFQLHLGDCLDVMATFEPNSIDTIITDPPYGLTFMGKDWDRGVPGVPFWREALRVAKPGAIMLAMGGTRTYHRLVCAIEDAGWEIRDSMAWLYGSGFPKSMDISKQFDKRAGVEREVVGDVKFKCEVSSVNKIKLTKEWFIEHCYHWICPNCKYDLGKLPGDLKVNYWLRILKLN
jgi:hypothetical protein